jgi:hypothetical protein
MYHPRERIRRFDSGKRVSIEQSIEKAMKTKISDTENVKYNMKDVRTSKNVQRSQGFQERCIKLAKSAKKQTSLVVPANGIGMQPETPFLHDVGVSNEGHLTVRQVASGGKRVSFTDTHTSRCFPFTDTHTKRVRFGKMDFIPPFGHNFGTRSVDVNSDTKLPDRITNNDIELLQAAARIRQYVDVNSDTKLPDRITNNDIELMQAAARIRQYVDVNSDTKLPDRITNNDNELLQAAARIRQYVDVNSDTKLPDRITNNDNELLQAAARILQYVDANMNSDTKLTDVNPNDIELPPATSIRHNVGDPINDVQLAVRHVASEGKRVRFAESYTKRVRFGGVELIPLSGQNFDTSSVDIKSKRNITRQSNVCNTKAVPPVQKESISSVFSGLFEKLRIDSRNMVIGCCSPFMREYSASGFVK